MAKSVTGIFMTASQMVVNGSQYVQYRASLQGGVRLGVMIPFGSTSVTFGAVPAGHYVGRIELSNGDGSLLGPGVDSDPFDVIDDATLDVPQSIVIALGPSV